MMKKFRLWVSFILLGLLLLCLGLSSLIVLSNRSLPSRSAVVDRLGEVEKARLAEAIHLRQALGEAAWPGWGQIDVPLIVYNEEFAFLVGFPDPPDGWIRMPQRERRGGAWEAVPDDRFDGQVYYRQKLLDPQKTPENFTVLVGERWVATMMTKEYAEISFYRGFQEELPSFLASVFPYRLAWGALMGETDTYIGGLEHEAFHAFQGSVAAERLERAEKVMRLEGQYPWDDPALDEAWKQEMDQLVRAAQARSPEEAREFARQFLELRDARRAALLLEPALVDFERQREWLEGLAKYAELHIVRLAGNDPGYQPAPALSLDPAFKNYTTRERFWSQQLGEARRTAGRSGETRFYYAGNAQAVLLDRLLPGWKERVLTGDLALEDLLREALR